MSTSGIDRSRREAQNRAAAVLGPRLMSEPALVACQISHEGRRLLLIPALWQGVLHVLFLAMTFSACAGVPVSFLGASPEPRIGECSSRILEASVAVEFDSALAKSVVELSSFSLGGGHPIYRNLAWTVTLPMNPESDAIAGLTAYYTGQYGVFNPVEDGASILASGSKDFMVFTCTDGQFLRNRLVLSVDGQNLVLVPKYFSSPKPMGGSFEGVYVQLAAFELSLQELRTIAAANEVQVRQLGLEGYDRPTWWFCDKNFEILRAFLETAFPGRIAP